MQFGCLAIHFSDVNIYLQQNRHIALNTRSFNYSAQISVKVSEEL